MLAGAMCATIERISRFHAVTNNAAAAMGTGGRQGMDGALETIEYMRLTAHPYLKTLIVHVAAHFTGGRGVAKHVFLCVHICLFSL
jgi:hypothetical protein